MYSVNKKPIYNLKVVVRETGLKPDTLRAWERRYNLPNPQRTNGGHRLYSQHDIEILKWLIDRQSEGMTISRAVALWQELTDREGDPFQVAYKTRPDKVESTTSSLSEIISERDEDQDTLQNLQKKWISACINFDEQVAEQTLTQAFSIFPIEMICTEMLQYVMKTIGEGWHEGRITIQQEHFASSLVIRRLESLLTATPAPTRVGRILVGCPTREEHTIGPLILTLLLKRKGWEVLYIGSNTPLQSLEKTVISARPDLVILAAQQLHTASNLLDMAHILRQAKVDLAFSGLIFHQQSILQQKIPGQYLGHDFDTAIYTIQQYLEQEKSSNMYRLIMSEQNVIQNPLESRVCHQAMVHYRERYHRIEADVWEKVSGLGIERKHLMDANINMERDIMAALNLGDINYFTLDLDWLEKFFVSRYQVAEHAILNYFKAYLKACQTHLDTPGYVITEWVARLLNKVS